MHSTQIKLVTIVCEPVLGEKLLSTIRSLGASGFTVTEVRGEGSAEKRGGEIPDLRLKVEVIADAVVSEKIMSEISQRYFQNYSLIVYACDVQVIRSEKF